MLQLPFIPGQIYNRRRDIHAVYGGNWQSGIAPSKDQPYIFIFTGKSGHQHGYEDGWDNPSVFSYTGEGQAGDMEFVRGNLALRNHVLNGKRVLLFEFEITGYVRFVNELQVFDSDYFESHDTAGNKRIAIKFFMQPMIALHAQLVKIPVVPIMYDTKTFDITRTRDNLKPTITERQGLVTSRVGQGAYRKRIIHRWEYQCAVTGFDKLEALVASHIVPWSQSTNDERLDVHNGILLSPTYDALFDRHLITFDERGHIVLSDTVEQQAYEKVGVTGNERIQTLSEHNQPYLERHRESMGGGG
ncbi:MAG: HNH endonuclease [bacterium]|nr:HNH endonuclease [bacterium]